MRREGVSGTVWCRLLAFLGLADQLLLLALLGFKTTGPTLNLAMQWTNERQMTRPFLGYRVGQVRLVGWVLGAFLAQPTPWTVKDEWLVIVISITREDLALTCGRCLSKYPSQIAWNSLQMIINFSQVPTRFWSDRKGIRNRKRNLLMFVKFLDLSLIILITDLLMPPTFISLRHFS